MSNHHHHDGGACGCEAHDHDDSPDRGAEFSLYRHIDTSRVRCLNELIPDSIRNVFKPWEERNDRTKFVESDLDEQLIVYVPFSGSCRLKAIAVKGGPEGNGPAEMRVWINREDVDFDCVESMQPLQQWDCMVNASSGEGGEGEPVEYQTRLAKFGQVRSLTLFFPSNLDESDRTRIDYLGFRGEFEELKQDPVITVYELNANPADHPKTLSDDMVGRSIQ